MEGYEETSNSSTSSSLFKKKVKKGKTRVVRIDSDSEGTDEFESSSDDEEVLEFDPRKDDYVEIPRARGDPLPETMELSQLSKERLAQFKTLYINQPQPIKEMMKIHFYKGNPVKKPPALSTFIQKVKAFKTKNRLEKRKQRKELEGKYFAANKSKGLSSTEKDKKKKPKEAKINLFEVHETDTQLIHVDFPGRVVNPDKAIATMGGFNSINKVFNNVNKKLPIRFRPDDPYCNATMGDPHPTVGLLIRVRRRKLMPKPKSQSKKQEDEEAILVDLEKEPESSFDSVIINGVRMTKEDILREDKEILKKATRDKDMYMKQYCCKEKQEQYYIKTPKDHHPKVDQKLRIEAYGIINRSYRFEGICDFQFLPMKKTANGMVSTRDKVLPLVGQTGGELESLFVGDSCLNGSIEIERFLVPPMMSRVDKPLDAIIDHFMDSDNVKLIPELVKHKADDILGSHRSKRFVHTVFHNFQTGDNVTPVPTEPLPGALDEVNKRRFHESVIAKVKNCFEKRPIWSRIALEYETQLSTMILKYILPCVSYFANNGPWRSFWIRLGYNPRQDQSSFLYQTVDFRVPFIYRQYIEEKDKNDESSYIFRPNTFPPRAQTFYQICDIKCEEIELLIDNATAKMGRYDVKYDIKFGWLKEGTFEYIRQVLNQYIEIYLQELGKITEHPVVKVFLKEGELEPREKIFPRRKLVKRFRKRESVKSKQKMSNTSDITPESTSSPTKSSKSKKSPTKGKSKEASKSMNHGILQDLSIKDIGRERETRVEEENEEDEDFESLDEDIDEAYDEDVEASTEEEEELEASEEDDEDILEEEGEIEEELKAKFEENTDDDDETESLIVKTDIDI